MAEISDSILEMGILSAAAPQPTPLLAVPIEDRLAEAHAAFRKSEVHLADAGLALARYNARNTDSRACFVENILFTRVNALSSDPVRRQLEKARDEALQKRSECLQVWSDLKLIVGGG